MSHIEKFWRNATAADVARVMAGEEVEARFRDCAKDEWKCRALAGWSRDSGSDSLVWASTGEFYYRYCQVYDPPQWFLDKPEPGEGYRLLGKFPDEPVQGGDFIRNNDGTWTELCNDCKSDQWDGYWYRRKIEPKPEPKFAVGQRVKIVGPPIKGEGPIYNWTKQMDQYIGVVGAVRLKPTQDPEGTFYAVGEIVGWSFREDYLEPVVEPEPKHYTLQVGDTADTGNGFRLVVTEHGVEVT